MLVSYCVWFCSLTNYILLWRKSTWIFCTFYFKYFPSPNKNVTEVKLYTLALFALIILCIQVFAFCSFEKKTWMHLIWITAWFKWPPREWNYTIPVAMHTRKEISLAVKPSLLAFRDMWHHPVKSTYCSSGVLYLQATKSHLSDAPNAPNWEWHPWHCRLQRVRVQSHHQTKEQTRHKISFFFGAIASFKLRALLWAIFRSILFANLNHSFIEEVTNFLLRKVTLCLSRLLAT